MVKQITNLNPATPTPADEFEFANPGGGANSSFRTTLDNLIKGSIVSGAGAPATTPNYVGERYFDTTGDREYIATGTVSAADWKPLSYVDGDTYSGTHDFSSATVNLGDGNVTNADLADMAANTIKGRQGTTGAPQDLTAAQTRTIINVEDGATADQTGPEIEAITRHDFLQGVDANQHIDWTASSAGSIDNTNVQDGADGSAIHDDTAGEIAAIAPKATPVSADFLLIEDSGDLNNKKRATIGSLPAASGANVGSGADVYRDNTGLTLNFRGINALGALSAEVNADNIDISLNEGAIDHDSLLNYVANEHIDWTTDQGATNIHSDNVQDGADATAIHRNLAAEISTITEKTTPVGTDILVIEDSAAANAKRRVQLANLPTAGGGEANTGANVGGAEEVFRDKSGSVLNFRTLQGTATVQVSTSTDVIQFTAVAANIDHDGLLNYVAQEHIRWDQAGAEDVEAGRVPDGADATAIHDNVAGEINSIALKSSPVSGDLILIEDSADTNNKKRITVGSLPGGGGGNAWSDPVDANIIPDADSTRTIGSGAARFVNFFGDAADIAGNITVTGTVDGRDVSVDGTKLDGVEAGADVTDATNVAAAGAAMDGGAFHDGFSDYSNNQHVPSAAVAFFDGGGSDIPANKQVSVYCPVAGTVTIASLRSPQTGSVTVTVARATFANFPTFTQLGTVALSSANKIDDTTLSGWTTAVSAGDTIRFTVSGNTGIQELMTSIGVDKT